MALDIKEASEKLEVVRALPQQWSAECFMPDGYQRVDGDIDQYTHTVVPELTEPTDDMERCIARAQSRLVSQSEALKLCLKLDTTRELKGRIIRFAARMCTLGQMEYSETLDEFHGTFFLGSESNPHEHSVTIDDAGQVVWREQYPNATVAGMTRWRQMRLFPGSSRVYRETSVVDECLRPAEIIGAHEMTTRHNGFMTTIEWRVSSGKVIQPALD